MIGSLNKRRLFARALRNEAPAGGGGEGGGGATPVTPPAQTQTTAPAWHESIQDEGLRQFIQGKGFKDAGEAAKALHELEGKTAVPESPDAYKLPVPDGQDAKFAQQVAGWMHKAGIPAAQAQALAEQWNAYQADQQQAAELARQQQGEADVAALKKEWGGQFEANAELGRRAVRTFGIDAGALEKISGALGDAETLRLFQRIGKHLGEGTLTPGAAGGSDQPTQSIADRWYPSTNK